MYEKLIVPTMVPLIIVKCLTAEYIYVMDREDEYTGIEAQNDPEFAQEAMTEDEYVEQLNKIKLYGH